MKKGDIVKINKLYPKSNGTGPQCLRHPSWARIVSQQDGKYTDYWNFQWLWPRFNKTGQNWFGHNALNVIQEDYDEFEIVPEDDVPDQVWAEVAKRTLLGETN